MERKCATFLKHAVNYVMCHFMILYKTLLLLVNISELINIIFIMFFILFNLIILWPGGESNTVVNSSFVSHGVQENCLLSEIVKEKQNYIIIHCFFSLNNENKCCSYFFFFLRRIVTIDGAYLTLDTTIFFEMF